MKTSLPIYVALVCLLSFAELQAQPLLWSKTDNSTYNQYSASAKAALPEKLLLSTINLAQLTASLSAAPLERADGRRVKGIPFSFMLPDGTIMPTSVVESPLWEAKYAAQFTNIKTYMLSDPAGKTTRGRITLTPEGISGILFADNGDVCISPANTGAAGTHLLYFSKDGGASVALCGITSGATVPPVLNDAPLGDCGRRTYRLAVAATAEYTAWAGSQASALTYITISINNVNALYERDLNIRFNIVSPNSILFTNAATDPYPGGDVYLDDAATNANQTALDNIIGSDNYDVGMVFNFGWNRGYVPVPFGFVCKPGLKGKGAAGVNSGQGLNPVAGPQGLAFDFTVAHEMGHLFGAPHSYASNAGFCTGFSTASSAFEPGSGSTLMGYAGYPTCNTYTQYGESYFHAGTIAQIKAYMAGAGSCAQHTTSENTAPVITLPASAYNVPVATPFALSSTATDAEKDNLIFTWEQMDVGFLTASPPAATNTAGPNFRSYAPTPAGNTRTFPRLQDIAAGISPPYEVLPSVARTMHFRLTARDQSMLGGCTSAADVAVSFSGSAPFKVTSQSSAITWATSGSQTITWDVAGTNASPINCTAVDILFSTDGGLTYPYMLASNTSNDGTETITVPNLSTTVGRVRVQAANNIFFNINAGNITIVSSCAAEGATFNPADSIAAPAGSAALNLALTPQYGTTFTPAGTITSANPSTFLTLFNDNINTCASYGFNGSYKYGVHAFTVVSPANYTFTPSTYGLIYNLYRGSFNPAFSCNNFIASNGVTGTAPTTIKPSVSAYLLPGSYILVAGTFSPTFPALPHNYNVAVTGGSIYTNPPNPGAAFSYLYVVVDRATNLIKSISATANLSSSATFPGGASYVVYGLSYTNASPSLSSFVGTNFNTLASALLTNGTYCGNLSKNSAKVTVLSVYTFTGSGNWDVAANWVNNSIPPSPLPQYSAIVISPAGSGECVLNVPMTISEGGQLKVEAGKKFRVLGNLKIGE
jgi:hypothetical protein